MLKHNEEHYISRQYNLIELDKIPSSINRKIKLYRAGILTLTVIAIGFPTGTSFEPSGASILARYLQVKFHENN